ncbi:MAG: hypothetical protein V2J25_11395 [Desulfatiglans sp.]|jgi:hypothetical protein|nr:hypothetical protein [Thermodesulfobacteriota bacterium]MEE4353462.1 hypothetical protein [Desulfatiglans sp.]
MGGKRKSKKRTARKTVLSEDEERLIVSLIESLGTEDRADIQSKIPDVRIAKVLVDRLPLHDESIVPLLLSLKSRFDDKALSKAVNRALFRLKAKGVDIGDASSPEEETPPILKSPPRETPSSFLGPVDGSGTRFVMVLLPRSSTGVDVGMGVVSDERGILQFMSGTFSKKRVREIKEGASANAGPLVKSSFSHGLSILEDAYHQVPDAPSGYLDIRQRMLKNGSIPELPSVYDLISEDSFSGETLTRASLETLFNDELMRTWFLDSEDLRPFMEELVHIEQSPLFFTEAQKQDRAREIELRALEKLFPPPKQGLLRRRLEEMAYLYFKLDREDLSRLCLAAARETVVEDSSTLRKSVVCEFLLERSLHYFMERAVEGNSKMKENEMEAAPPLILP